MDLPKYFHRFCALASQSHRVCLYFPVCSVCALFFTQSTDIECSRAPLLKMVIKRPMACKEVRVGPRFQSRKHHKWIHFHSQRCDRQASRRRTFWSSNMTDTAIWYCGFHNTVEPLVSDPHGTDTSVLNTKKLDNQRSKDKQIAQHLYK